jgi:hypothetical protein
MRLRAQFVGVLLVVGLVGAYLWWILAALESESTPAICGPRAAPPRYDREHADEIACYRQTNRKGAG